MILLMSPAPRPGGNPYLLVCWTNFCRRQWWVVKKVLILNFSLKLQVSVFLPLFCSGVGHGKICPKLFCSVSHQNSKRPTCICSIVKVCLKFDRYLLAINVSRLLQYTHVVFFMAYRFYYIPYTSVINRNIFSHIGFVSLSCFMFSLEDIHFEQ